MYFLKMRQKRTQRTSDVDESFIEDKFITGKVEDVFLGICTYRVKNHSSSFLSNNQEFFQNSIVTSIYLPKKVEHYECFHTVGS